MQHGLAVITPRVKVGIIINTSFPKNTVDSSQRKTGRICDEGIVHAVLTIWEPG
jgi:hypothetical protein